MWSRQFTSEVGMQEEQFTKAFVKALKHEEVVKTKRSIIRCEMQEELRELQQELKELKEVVSQKNKQIDELGKRLKAAEVQLDTQEQYSRRNSIRIYGLSEDENEDATKKTLDLFQQKMNIDVQPSDIDRIHRIGRKDNASRHRPLIVKFATYRARNRVFRAKAQLKDSETRSVFINEDLTRTRSELFYKARRMKKSKQIMDCWTFDGKILVKTNQGAVKPVVTLEELEQTVHI